jgi:hypothetical protein
MAAVLGPARGPLPGDRTQNTRAPIRAALRTAPAASAVAILWREGPLCGRFVVLLRLTVPYLPHHFLENHAPAAMAIAPAAAEPAKAT